MNRVFDERLEQQLQEYEFAELDQLLPPDPLIHAVALEEDNTTDTLASVTQ
jgi:hypothetical protein